MTRSLPPLILTLCLAVIQGCATYTTPAGGVNIPSLGDGDIAELMAVEPAATFPARIAVARIQSSGYSSRTNDSYGSGRYSVVTTRDMEDESDFAKLAEMQLVAGVAPVGRLLLPEQLDSIKDLRLSAARLKADMLLLYSVDTAFHVEGKALGPLTAITLGFLPSKQAFVSSTTSGVLVDVRTGYIYGVAEATERNEQRTTVWDSADAVDRARVQAEAASFKRFVGEVGTLWGQTVEQYAVSEPEPQPVTPPQPPQPKPAIPATLEPSGSQETYTF
ncbi:hypothetical protein SAMN05216271_1865 [Halopseudomonas sabulinigri]|uniref:Curli production assembly/transport component CsgG n=1 Tax=Halopseudomonas sabulinigri TaxID=472181 RepID=A0A1H1S001_9GAMM|nr:hypothetical protein [Halopseudomonas sabulinigri]SDS41148.1 hypothetical protein SAMN05216271_1865 [Halopseudomonas sabulinigri]